MLPNVLILLSEYRSCKGQVKFYSVQLKHFGLIRQAKNSYGRSNVPKKSSYRSWSLLIQKISNTRKILNSWSDILCSLHRDAGAEIIQEIKTYHNIINEEDQIQQNLVFVEHPVLHT